MIITSSIAVAKVSGVFLTLGLALLAVGESASNRTLIIISAITSGTSLLGVVISGAISLHNARKLALVAELPKKVEEFRKEVDGRMSELKTSREETAQARAEVARGEGIQQEREAERERASAVLAVELPVIPAEPAQVVIVNEEHNPVPIRPAETKGKTT